MSLLPAPGSDVDLWGDKMNAFLRLFANEADGTLKATAVLAALGRNPVAIIAPADATATEKARADFVCDGVDDHVEITQAQTDLGANGGKIELQPGNFSGGQYVQKNKIWVAGAGRRATTYKLKAGVNADAWINYVSADGIEANAEFIRVSDLCLDANKAQQTAGNGFSFTSNPSATKATNDIDFDTHNGLYSVDVINAFQDGVVGASRSEMRFFDVYSERAGRYSFNPTYDTFFDLCTAAHAGLAGYFVQSSSVRFTNCKAFYSGQVTPGSGRGWWIKNTHGIMLAGCEAQDNNDAGVLLDGAEGCIIQVSLDSNSTRGIASAPALDLFGASYNVIMAGALERMADGTNSYQRNALRLRSGCAANDIVMSHRGWSGATIGTALMAGSDPTATGANRVFVNAAAV